MKRAVQKFLILFAAVCLLSLGLRLEEARASGEDVHFGSEAYEWELNLDSPSLLGVYASADGELDTAEFYVIYDPEMLEFASGGELVEPGKIRVRSTEIEGNEFKRMMSFTPLKGGTSEVRIEEASITEAGGAAVTVAQKKVSVSTAIPDGCRLSGISVDGAQISGFDAENTDYTLELEEYTDRVNITLLPENANAEISDTKLSPGENEIHIVTTNDDGEQARYTLYINCPEEAAAVNTVPEETVQPTEKTEPEPEENSDADEDTIHAFLTGCLDYIKDMLLNHKAWSAAAGVLIILFVCLLIIKGHLERKRKRARKERERRRQERIKAEAAEKADEDFSRNGEETYQDNLINIDIENLQPGSRLRAADKVANPGRVSQERAAKDEMIFEAATVTEEDLAAASDFMEEDEVEIDVSHVTIDFKRDSDEASSVKELVIRTLTGKRSVVKFRALDDVSFTVMKGEVVGIIGTNGSGKSTILKIISGVLSPTEGSVTVDKQKIQLLTLGTGFDTELTGRENVYLNGAIIGYTKEYIDEKYDDIVEFAELDGFMDEKVKNYSSGMVSRLGFAIATVRDTPEILILDEVLSVGDMFFRKKSEARIQEMIHGGSTVLIVSHSPSVIRKNCTKVVWIEKGKLKAVGDPKEICAAYEKMSR